MNIDLLIYFVVLLNRWIFIVKSAENDLYTNEYVIHVKGGELVAKRVAESNNNFIFHGQLGSLDDYYLLEHKTTPKRTRRSAEHHEILENHPDVLWFEQQKILSRKKRDFKISDPLFVNQWYIKNTGQPTRCPDAKLDINVFAAWKLNFTGQGVVVSILDDGLEYSHQDLQRNYDAKASWDYNSKDDDPFPRYSADNINKHGTRCAGEVAAERNNNVCGVGVSYNAKVGGIRMLDGDVTDAVESQSLSLKPQYIDIYSSSWGPDDDGKTVDGPGPMAKKSFIKGIQEGRKGLGSIFVWATGNGGQAKDYCACDGYINSIYTISIGAVDNCGKQPWYAEPCPGTLAVTYSSGVSGTDLQIVTTDLHDQCTKDHTGTSAAAPLAAGIFALVLEANPRLTWRDLQHLIVHTSKPVGNLDEWQENGAGHKVNNKFGFGALDTGALVAMATDAEWKTATQQFIFETEADKEEKAIPTRGSVVKEISTDGCSSSADDKICITQLEHVQVFVTLSHYRRGMLELTLESPSGIRSNLLQRRPHDTSREGFSDWPFLTVFNWDENPKGVWKLTATDFSGQHSPGTMKSWRLKFFGTTENQASDAAKDERDVCQQKCKQGCVGPVFAQECVGCSSLCDCTKGECVSACSSHLVFDAQARHCLSPREANYEAPNSGTPNSATSNDAIKKHRPLIGISLSAKFAIICLALVVLCALVAGIAYMANRMPRAGSDYRTVPRYPCQDTEEGDDDEQNTQKTNLDVNDHHVDIKP